jgi:hypothetical protein
LVIDEIFLVAFVPFFIVANHWFYVKNHAVIIAESVEGDTHTILRPEASVSHAKEL